MKLGNPQKSLGNSSFFSKFWNNSVQQNIFVNMQIHCENHISAKWNMYTYTISWKYGNMYIKECVENMIKIVSYDYFEKKY